MSNPVLNWLYNIYLYIKELLAKGRIFEALTIVSLCVLVSAAFIAGKQQVKQNQIILLKLDDISAEQKKQNESIAMRLNKQEQDIKLNTSNLEIVGKNITSLWAAYNKLTDQTIKTLMRQNQQLIAIFANK